MANGAAHAVSQVALCPTCEQPVPPRKLEEIQKKFDTIREEVRREDKTKLKALEQQLRVRIAAENRARLEQVTRRAAEITRRERTLEQRAQALEATAKPRYDEGYRKARTESARVQMQLHKQVEDLKRRLERKTADELGAVSEEDLLALLRGRYPHDGIEPVGRGHEGADIVHEVRHRGAACGRIIYESKNVKNFLSSFVEKARGYRTRYDTAYVVVVTTAFPAGERDFCVRDGILLVHPGKVSYVVDIIRAFLVDLARAGAALDERETKGEKLLAFVASDEFKQRLRGVLEAVDELRMLQAEERKRHERTWGVQETSLRAIEKFTGRIQARVSAIVEGHRAQDGADG